MQPSRQSPQHVPPAQPRSDDASLSMLTGVRSGKTSYYRELQRTEERMTSAVRALEGISSALVRTRDDPVGLLHGVLRAAAGHLHADWVMVALRDATLPRLGVRFLAVGRTGVLLGSERALPASLREQLYQVRLDHDAVTVVRDGWVQVPMLLDGEVLGRLVVSHLPGGTVDPEDLWVLRILANQAAMSIQTSTLYTAATEQREHAQHLLDEIARSSEDLRTRTAELHRAEGKLTVLHQRELIDAERHRIALELHDSVAQYVLSAGLAVDVCRAEAAEHDGADAASVHRLVHARDLVAQAGDQVRSVIYALHHQPVGDDVATLPDLLHGLAAQHRPTFTVGLRVVGTPVELGAKTEHALARVAGEALFNTSIHARATRASVRLHYQGDRVSLSVSDDGVGDPRELRQRLRTSANAGSGDGRHQGLSNMWHRATDLGGTFAVHRARMGGIRIDVSLPIPGPTGA